MSFAFYYPYYSARDVAVRPPQFVQQQSALHLRDNIQLQRRLIEEVVRNRQEKRNEQRLRQYEEQLRSKQALNNLIKQDQLIEEIPNQHEQIYKYYQQLQQKLINQTIIQQKRQIKPHQTDKQHQMKQNLRPNSALNEAKRASQIKISRMTNSLKQNREIQTQRAIQQYQKELLNKINGKGKMKDNNSKQNKSYIDKYRIDEAQQDIIINKKTIDHTLQQNKKTIIFKDQRKRSNIKHDKQTINKYNTINNNTNTINLSLIQQPFLQHKYKIKGTSTSRRNKSTIKAKKTINQTDRTHKKNNLLDKKQKSKANKPKNPLHRALKRIQNRLKVSMIVYRDSQLMNKRHQIWHLENTYEAQVRLRRQLKDKINNNPLVLEKHNLVVSSR